MFDNRVTLAVGSGGVDALPALRLRNGKILHNPRVKR